MKFKYYKPGTYQDKWGFRIFGWHKHWPLKHWRWPTFLLHTPIGHFWLWTSNKEANDWPQQA